MSEETETVATLRKVTTGPFKNLNFPGHATAEDFDREAGKVGECVDEADSSVAYRSTLPEFHEKFTPILEKMSGLTRGVNQTATDKAKSRAKDPSKIKDIPASFIDFANQVKATLNKDMEDNKDSDKWKLIDQAARECAATVKIDASPSSRQAGVPKEYKAKAESLLTLPTDQLEAKITAWGEKYDSIDVSNLERDEAGKPTVESLGRLVGQVMAEKLMED